MTTQEEKMKDLVDIGFVRFKDDIPIRLYDSHIRISDSHTVFIIFNEISFLSTKNKEISKDCKKKLL